MSKICTTNFANIVKIIKFVHRNLKKVWALINVILRSVKNLHLSFSNSKPFKK